MANYRNVLKDRKLITGIGSALVDILINETDRFLDTIGGEKGAMTFADLSQIENAVSVASNEPVVVPGGSACNTAVGVGRLGGSARFVGKCGEGQTAEFYRTALKRCNVDPCLIACDSPTGKVLSVITPDAQRTFLTYLGASAQMNPKEISQAVFRDSAVVHLEGYLLFNTELIFAALDTAKASGALVSLDLASFNVVEEAKDTLDKIVKEYVDILIANEDESYAFTGYADEEKAIETMAEHVDIAVLKVGARGSLIHHDNKVTKILPAGSGQVIDTTGAGDLWAAGFLYGLVNGYSIKDCGRLASLCGYEVCRVVGAHIDDDGWKRIKEQMGE